MDIPAVRLYSTIPHQFPCMIHRSRVKLCWGGPADGDISARAGRLGHTEVTVAAGCRRQQPHRIFMTQIEANDSREYLRDGHCVNYINWSLITWLEFIFNLKSSLDFPSFSKKKK